MSQDSIAFDLREEVNPFDIESSGGDSGRSDFLKVALAQDSLVLDVNNETILPATINSEPDLDESEEDFGNPFDVNHVPIRKNQISTNPIEESSSNESVIDKHFALIVFMCLLVLIAVIVSRSREFIGSIFEIAVRDNALASFIKKENNGKSLNILLIYGFALLSIGFFFTLVLFPSFSDISQWWLFGSVMGFVLLWYLLKHTFLFFLKAIFSIQNEVDYYSSQIVIWNVILGIILFVLSIFIAYGPTGIVTGFTYLGLGILAISAIAKIGKSIYRALGSIFNQPLQFFIYLCAFEIAPLLLLIRFVQH